MSEETSPAGRSRRWQRREVRRARQRARIEKHGASLRQIYANAVRKRAGRMKKKSE